MQIHRICLIIIVAEYACSVWTGCYSMLLYFMQISYIIHSFHWASGIC